MTLPLIELGGRAFYTHAAEATPEPALKDLFGRFAEMGVTGAAVHIDGRTRAEWCDNAARYGAEVVAIEKQPAGFRLGLKDGSALTADQVVFAIGMQGNLRKLEVPGADLPCVQYQLDDPEEYRGEVIVVVGAGDAAIENAIALAAQNEVVIVNRIDEFARVKDGNLKLITKAIESGRQVAVLVPTTLLAHQHYENFAERFAPFPTKVAVLSRMQPPKETKATLKDLYDGVPMDEVRKGVVLAARTLIEKDPQYSYVTARLLLDALRFEALGTPGFHVSWARPAIFAAALVLDRPLLWQSSDTTIVSVNASGRIVGIAAGQVQLQFASMPLLVPHVAAGKLRLPRDNRFDDGALVTLDHPLLGPFGHLATLSFYPAHHITTGEALPADQRERSFGAMVEIALEAAFVPVGRAGDHVVEPRHVGVALRVGDSRAVLFTRAGWTLIIVGNGVGFLFAALVLTISAVSFPMLLDRDGHPSGIPVQVAKALSARKLLLVSNVPGVLADKNDPSTRIPRLTPELARDYLTRYSVHAGESTVARWRKLGEHLLWKYLDGNVRDAWIGRFASEEAFFAIARLKKGRFVGTFSLISILTLPVKMALYWRAGILTTGQAPTILALQAGGVTHVPG